MKKTTLAFFLYGLSLCSCVEPKPKTLLETPNEISKKTVSSICPDCISTEEVNKHLDENVKVMGIVKKVTNVEWEESEPTFIDLDNTFPANAMNVVVFKDKKGKFKNLDALQNKKISVEGVVKMHHYKGNSSYPASDYPQIILTDPKQIKILE